MSPLVGESATISNAIDRGIRFLASQQGQDGLWSDFCTRAGWSVDWVSGMVMHAVGTIPEAAGLAEAGAQALLTRQRSDGGWGYNMRIPSDADSSAWVLRGLLGSRFVQPHRTRSALARLMLHEVGNTGGFATFTQAAHIASVIVEPDDTATLGWQSPHVCVTANVVLALVELGDRATGSEVSRALAFLLAARSTDALWRGYWWRGPVFTTYLVLLALVTTGRLAQDGLDASLAALAARQNTDGGWGDGDEGEPASYPFASALGLLALGLEGGDRLAERRDHGLDWLLASQLHDGSWAATPVLRIPDAHIVDPSTAGQVYAARLGTNVVVADERRIFTTAAVVRALHVQRFRPVKYHA